MSETTPPTPPTSGRVRRRASRQAGPVGEHGKTGVASGGAAASTDAAAAADTSAQRDTADAASTAELRGSGVGAAAGASKAAADSTVKRGKTDADSTAQPGTAAAESTVRLDKADSTGESGAAGASDTDDAAPVDEPVDAEKAVDEESGGFWQSMRLAEWVAAAVAVISLIVLVGGGATYFYHERHADALAAQRAEYVQTAKQAILNLTNIKDDTAKQDIDRVLSVASGDLKAEYSERKDAYAQVVQQAKVRASGAVIEAAIESQNNDSAQVLVAAKQTLTNAGDQQPQDRYYRFRVTVNRGDGGVTASKVEFVA